MPNLDNTGPDGNGPTGRGRGSCPNKDKTCFGRGRGWGQSRGRGRGSGGRGFVQGQGRRCGFGMGADRFVAQDNKAFLESEIKAMEEQLSLMKTRFDEMEE